MARHWVVFDRMLSRVGQNVQHCVSLFGVGVEYKDLINGKMASFLHIGSSDCCKVNIIHV